MLWVPLLTAAKVQIMWANLLNIYQTFGKEVKRGQSADQGCWSSKARGTYVIGNQKQGNRVIVGS